MAKRNHSYPIGIAIKEYKKINHITQGRLASRFDVSISYISRFELGKEHLSIDNFIRFAKALKVDPEDLLNMAISLKENPQK